MIERLKVHHNSRNRDITTLETEARGEESKPASVFGAWGSLCVVLGGLSDHKCASELSAHRKTFQKIGRVPWAGLLSPRLPPQQGLVVSISGLCDLPPLQDNDGVPRQLQRPDALALEESHHAVPRRRSRHTMPVTMHDPAVSAIPALRHDTQSDVSVWYRSRRIR